MKYKTRIYITKIIINIFGCFAILSAIIYMIPIIMAFKTDAYSMALISKLFTISMILYCLYLLSINKILNRYNKIDNMECYKKYIEEMIDMSYILHTVNTTVLVLLFIAVIITYAVLWWKADVYILEAMIEYILLVISTTINASLIIKYINSFKYFNKRLYDEVCK